MRITAYILDEQGRPVVTDLLTAARWHARVNLQICDTTVDDVRISTVFYGMPPFGDPDEPRLWESMVFGGRLGGYQERYTSEDDARRGHAQIVARVIVADVTTKPT